MTIIPLTADSIAVAAFLLHLEHRAARRETPFKIHREPSVNWERASEICHVLEMAGLATIERMGDVLHVDLTPRAARRLDRRSREGEALRDALVNAVASSARGGCHSILLTIAEHSVEQSS